MSRLPRGSLFNLPPMLLKLLQALLRQPLAMLTEIHAPGFPAAMHQGIKCAHKTEGCHKGSWHLLQLCMLKHDKGEVRSWGKLRHESQRGAANTHSSIQALSQFCPELNCLWLHNQPHIPTSMPGPIAAAGLPKVVTAGYKRSDTPQRLPSWPC